MKTKSWMRTFTLMAAGFLLSLVLSAIADASDDSVVAVNAATGGPIYEGALIQARNEGLTIVDKQNLRVELAPNASGQFLPNGDFRLYRGSVAFESKSERRVLTANAEISFNGEMVASYDFKEKSTSNLVVDGVAKMRNPFSSAKVLTLKARQGATIVTGSLEPNLVRGLDRDQADQWLKNYGWAEEKRHGFVHGIAKGSADGAEENVAVITPTEALTPFFQSLDDERALLEGNVAQAVQSASGEVSDLAAEVASYNPTGRGIASVLPGEVKQVEKSKNTAPKTPTKGQNPDAPTEKWSPERAALIPLPIVDIESEFPGLFDIEKMKSTRQIKRQQQAEIRAKASRKPASTRAIPVARHSDPEVASVLTNLDRISSERSSAIKGRAPASLPLLPEVEHGTLPDPVFDYSENF